MIWLALAVFAVGALVVILFERKKRKGISAAAEQEALPEGWHIGPVLGGRNYSKGLPPEPTNSPDGPVIEISPTSEPHYITRASEPLIGKSEVRLRYRVEAPEGVRYCKPGCPNGPGTITLYFQAKDPLWLTDGGRWWASFATHTLKAGTYEDEIEVSLLNRWTGVEQFNAVENQGAFDAAKANAGRIGFTIGDCTGLGHGTLASHPVKLTILAFEVS